MQGGATRRRVVSHFSTKIPLRRYFSGPAAVGYSLLFVSLLLTPYWYSDELPRPDSCRPRVGVVVDQRRKVPRQAVRATDGTSDGALDHFGGVRAPSD